MFSMTHYSISELSIAADFMFGSSTDVLCIGQLFGVCCYFVKNLLKFGLDNI